MQSSTGGTIVMLTQEEYMCWSFYQTLALRAMR